MFKFLNLLLSSILLISTLSFAQGLDKEVLLKCGEIKLTVEKNAHYVLGVSIPLFHVIDGQGIMHPTILMPHSEGANIWVKNFDDGQDLIIKEMGLNGQQGAFVGSSAPIECK